MSDRQAKAAAKRQRRAARPQGGSGPKPKPKPEPSHWPHITPPVQRADELVARIRARDARWQSEGIDAAEAERRAGWAAVAAVAGTLALGAPAVPLASQPPPGKYRR